MEQLQQYRFVMSPTLEPYENLTLLERFGQVDSSDQGWTKLKAHVHEMMGENRPRGIIHKLLFLTRPGQGWHNIAEEKYGKKAWDDHWSKLNGDGEIVWGPDAKLTPLGIEQAQKVNKMWRSQPLSRAIDTADITFRGWYYPDRDEPGAEREFGNFPTVVFEELHETRGKHTCDKRSPKSTLEKEYTTLDFPNIFAEDDSLWDPDVREMPEQQDVRSKRVLSMFALEDIRYGAVSAHSGTINSIFRVIGHPQISVPPGGVVPVLVKITQLGPINRDDQDDQDDQEVENDQEE